MRSLVLFFVFGSYIIDLQAFSYSDFKELCCFICARLAHVSILSTSSPQLEFNMDTSESDLAELDYDSDISDFESSSRSKAKKNKIFKLKKRQETVSYCSDSESDDEQGFLLKRISEKNLRRNKKSKNMFAIFKDDVDLFC